MKQARDYLTALHLDYVNNYLTVERFAEHNGLLTEQANRLLRLAKEVAETPHPEA